MLCVKRKAIFLFMPSEIWLVMRLTAFLLTFALLQVSARSVSQNVTYSGKNVPIDQFFSAVRQQTGFAFFYNDQDLRSARPVTVELRNVPLEKALEESLAGQPLAFVIKGNTVFITPKKMAPVLSPAALAIEPPNEVRGQVTDSLGNPLAGASVVVKGTRKGTSTDAAGSFRLSHVGENATLLISFSGYFSREIKLNGKDYFDIVLQRNNSPLDAVQVIAYGTNIQRYNLGSVSSLTSEEIAKQPVMDVLLALEGRVPGLSVSSTSGAPGAAVNLQIRGQNTLSSSSGLGLTLPFDQPLFIVDGVPFAPQNRNTNLYRTMGTPSSTPFNDQSILNAGLSPFSSINPADIERIDVLRDADATSIYGSQGANGVILITTKKGKPGATRLDVYVKSGASKATRIPKMMTTQQYLAMRRNAVISDGMGSILSPPGSNDPYNQKSYPDLLVFDSTRYTDWGKEFLGGEAPFTDAHASLSGGTQTTTFNLTGGYTHTGYSYPGGFADNRVSANAGFHHNSSDHRLVVDLSTYYSYDRNNSSTSSLSAFALPPNQPDLLDGNGKLVWLYKGIDVVNNPFAYLKQSSDIQSYNLNSNLKISYQLLPGLNLSSGFGYSKYNTRQYNANPSSSYNPTALAYIQSSANFGNTDQETLIIEPQLSYNRTLGRGKLDVLAGGTYKKNSNDQTTLTGTGYSSDDLLGSIAQASAITATTHSLQYKYAAFFGRIGYNWSGKYLINLTGRRDGSSNFGPGRQFGNFGSVAAGWIFSEEPFFKKALPFISFGKLRGSYGTTGTDGIAPYQYQANWGPANASSTSPFQGVIGLQPLNLFNPVYSWAVNKKSEAGVDLGFLKDRIVAGLSIYQSRCGNQLVQYQLPIQTGFFGVAANLPALVQNSGIEITLTTTNIRTPDFTWTSSFNISFQKNKLLAFPGLETSPYASTYFIGKSVNTMVGAKYAGVDSTGAYRYAKGKGGYTNRPNFLNSVEQGGDGYFLPNTDPKYFGGLNNTFSYKNFNLSFFLRFNKQTGQNYRAGIYSSGQYPGAMSNLPAAMAGHFWQKPGDQASFARPITAITPTNIGVYFGNSYYYFSDAVYSDASYIRLQNLSFSYTMPDSWLRKARVKNCVFTMSAQNLLTITGYELGDPETRNLYSIPVQRTIVAGLSFTF